MAPVLLADVIANRTSISLARSQRLIESWLPLSSSPSDSKTEAEQDEEDARIFIAEPESLGLGRSSQDVGEKDKHGADFTARDSALRQRMLGKRKRHDMVARVDSHHGASKPRPPKDGQCGRAQSESGDEDEAGRSALGKARRTVAGERDEEWALDQGHAVEAIAKEEVMEDGEADEIGVAMSQKPKTFLDEVLAEQAKKRKRKKRRKKKKDNQGVP